MDKISVVLANRDVDVLNELSVSLNRIEDIQISAAFTTAGEALEALKCTDSTVLITDFQLESGDVFGLLRKLQSDSVETKVVICSQYAIRPMIDRATRMGAVSFVEYPCTAETLAEHIYMAADTVTPSGEENIFLVMRVERLLLTLGITPGRKGFQCLKLAILLWLSEGEKHTGMTKWIYPAVASRVGIKPSAVERSIRVTIAKLWEEPMTPIRWRIFSENWAGKSPTNSQFVAMLALYLNRPWAEPWGEQALR